ncbi:hypothetical protein C2R22_03025 [Salinigranum rubrum]|uniref:Uncharacterized protein n=1 Tax=Salinigranum rubrum TaxID=755307 RepID=A0A2I8VFP1_9EURY|nr:hypothetical protein C2R22_03025 [Salinigranum rubrum]
MWNESHGSGVRPPAQFVCEACRYRYHRFVGVGVSDSGIPDAIGSAPNRPVPRAATAVLVSEVLSAVEVSAQVSMSM